MNWFKRFSILGTVAIASLAIAQSASARFVIFVSGNDAATLQRVRTVSPSAFATQINGQPVVQAGIFNSETSADSLAITLQQSGLSAQKYFQASGGKETNVQVPFVDTTSSPVVNTSVASSPVVSVANPQQVVIQQNPIAQSQPVSFQTEPQTQFISSVPQQAIAYDNNQYQQITTSAVVPQVQTQQVLVPRWQQVLVPETRQVVTQTVVPQTQIVQTGSYTQGYVQQPIAYNQAASTSAYIQPSVQTTTGYTQATGSQVTNYVQPQTGFIPATSVVTTPSTYNSSLAATNSVVIQPQPTSTAYSSASSSEPQLPQAAQNSNFRYVAAVPSAANNPFLLSRVRQYVPRAFLSSSGRGTYIHAGAYQNRDSAEAVSRYLRSQGVDSRVLYF